VGWEFALGMVDAEALPESDLWQFSLALYALPGVAPTLIALQDKDGRDVNLMLFALWLGISGRGRLDGAGLAAAERAVREIRTEIVEPLRALRRRLRPDSNKDMQHLREGVKALELAAEKLAQRRLARLAGPRTPGASPPARLAAAEANLALYLGPETARGGDEAVIRLALAAFAQEN
jgi:uncharacterized protein (TIGR02444 family)